MKPTTQLQNILMNYYLLKMIIYLTILVIYLIMQKKKSYLKMKAYQMNNYKLNHLRRGKYKAIKQIIHGKEHGPTSITSREGSIF